MAGAERIELPSKVLETIIYTLKHFKSVHNSNVIYILVLFYSDILFFELT